MIHEILVVGPLRCNCSILGDEASHEAIVVDPGDDISRIVATLQRHSLTVKQIIITHVSRRTGVRQICRPVSTSIANVHLPLITYITPLKIVGADSSP